MKFPALFKRKSLAPIPYSGICASGGWFPIIRESFAGAWQQNVTISHDCALAYSAVYSCLTLIASDIAKLPIKLVELGTDGIWAESPAKGYEVLRKPNRFQNRIRFIEQWVISKLSRGNAYILKERDQDGQVIALYVLDPSRVTVLVAPDGSVFYQLNTDNLAGLETGLTLPSSEIIHDMLPGLFHPLCGTPPIFACGLSALQGLNIQKNSAKFFGNMSRPSGILTAPGAINPETAARLKEAFEENFSKDNIGRIAVLGDGLKYEAMTITATDAQLIEQLKWTAQDVCSCFHVPAYKVGFADTPTYNNAEILNQIYYTDCLQSLIESIELCLDEGLGLVNRRGRKQLGVEFDLDVLLRMDTETRYKSYGEAISKGWLAPNEARAKEDMKPVKGGESPYLQQQNYSLEALAKRDAKDDPFAKETIPPASPQPEPDPDLDKDQTGKALGALNKRPPETLIYAGR